MRQVIRPGARITGTDNFKGFYTWSVNSNGVSSDYNTSNKNGYFLSGENVVSTTGTSASNVMSQSATTSIVYADPSTATKVRIGSGAANAESAGVAIGTEAAVNLNAWSGVAIGTRAVAKANQAIAIGQDATMYNSHSIAIGEMTTAGHNYSIALGRNANTTRQGELFIGCKNYNYGYNNTKNRVIGGVYDGQLLNDAATVKQAVGTTETYAIATSDWSALSASSPYDYSATVTATYTIGNNTIAELINDNPVLFGNHGFAIGSISSQSVTIYSIGVPNASVSLKINYKG